jgi:hypothetical protein
MLLTSDLSSFGRDCAQALKKMSESKKLKPGPKRKLSDSARKRNKKAANGKLNKNRIYIGDEYDRWMEIKTALRLEVNSEVAKIL